MCMKISLSASFVAAWLTSKREQIDKCIPEPGWFYQPPSIKKTWFTEMRLPNGTNLEQKLAFSQLMYCTLLNRVTIFICDVFYPIKTRIRITMNYVDSMWVLNVMFKLLTIGHT